MMHGFALPNTPSTIALSTAIGRCGPCCSIAATGCSNTVFALSGSAAICGQVR